MRSRSAHILQGKTDVKILPDIGFQDLKWLATRRGKDQGPAFAELACRTRREPSVWAEPSPTLFWGPLDTTRAPTTPEMEWAFLKWSQRLIDETHTEIERMLAARLQELEPTLDLNSPGAPAIRYHNAIGDELRRQEAEPRPSDTGR